MDNLVSDPSSPNSMCLVSEVKYPTQCIQIYIYREVTVGDILLAVFHIFNFNDSNKLVTAT